MQISRFLLLWAVLALGAGSMPAAASVFAAMASPPRFEIQVTPGVRGSEIIEITNGAPLAARYRIYTNDWSMAADGGAIFHDALQPRSCRPWVALQRKEVTIPPGGRIRFRFEVTPPPDAPVGECRFAVMIEGDDESGTTANGVKFPVSGRLGVIVYARLGDARPRLELGRATTIDINGQRVPAIEVRNSGSAHGRLSGFLSGTDAKGRRLEFAPANLPILPDDVRAIALTPSLNGKNIADLAYPVTIRGSLEWGDQREPFEQSFN